MVNLPASFVEAPAGVFGSIRWEVDKDSISEEEIYSHAIKVEEIPWRIGMKKHKDGISSFLHRMECDYKVLSVDLNIDFRLINYKDDANTVIMKAANKKKELSYCGVLNLSMWNIAIDEEKGFIKNNKFNVQVDFWPSNIVKSRKRRRFDFTDPNEPSHDVTLVVEKERFYVGKSYLSVLSSYFKSLFYGEFAENNQKEIELKDINGKEFGEMMKVIYPPYMKITEDNFDYLLKLGDRLDIEMVVDRVEQFLITSKLTVAAKLVLAGRYSLVELQIHCVDGLKSIKEVTDVKKSVDAKYFTDAINLALLDKIVKLSD